MCFVLGIICGAFANVSAPMLSLNKVHFTSGVRSRIFKNDLFLLTFLSLVVNLYTLWIVIYIQLLSLTESFLIAVCWNTHVIGHPANGITHPIFDLTEFGSYEKSLV
jgi:hypothetical protein